MDNNKKQNDNHEYVAQLTARITELENNWKRALADYKNLEKRTFEENDQIIKFATQVLISRLLPVLDNLEMLSKHLGSKEVDMILKDFNQILKDEGLEEIEMENDTEFNPNTMEAIEMVEGENNKVVEVTQKGYKLKNKVIRPAKVKVGQGLKEEN